MKIQEMLEFSKDNYFNGAVQTDWFYDQKRLYKIAQSYVFHGPKYFGVSNEDVSLGQHKLIDTASFVNNITSKLYSTDSQNKFIMTIAGYGTGKSHLAVTLGALFSGHDHAVRSVIIENICRVDCNIGSHIREITRNSNLVIVLNGMKNFNLDFEVLNCAKKALALHNISDEILTNLTKSYSIAKHFLEQTFIIREQRFIHYAKENGISFKGENLKNYLINHVERDKVAFSVINNVYQELNGDEIRWERGISAGDVLATLSNELCGDGKPFNKVLVIFDEFGRFIEYAATNPTVAGEAALQQIFEAVQDSNGKIIFAGFIQSELSAYLSRIEKTANIVRYIGRYETSEKLYLSSNFETILANLIKKKDEQSFDRLVGLAIDHYDHYHSAIASCLARWSKKNSKTVWTNKSLYVQIILKGCYPLHPISVWLLSNMSSWMQQRSTITFAAEMFEAISGLEIEGTWLPYVYPINIVDSSIYNEMLSSEEKGLVQSQYCMLYRDIMLKVGDKLKENELKVLKAILITNIGRFVFRDKEDAINAISYCSGIKDDVPLSLQSLENMHGVIAFDDVSNSYDLIAEASGFNEFKRVFNKYRIRTASTIADYDEEMSIELHLDKNIETSFAQEHCISSTEWCFKKKIMDIDDFDNNFCNSVKRELEESYNGEASRGLVTYLYCTNQNYFRVENVKKLYNENRLSDYAIVLILLYDVESDIVNAMCVRSTLKQFSISDQNKFVKFISSQNKSQLKKIVQSFNKMLGKREQITGDGIATYNVRMSALCTSIFNKLYWKAPSFSFDGFEKKSSTQAKKYLSNICIKLFDNTLMNIQSYQALTQEEKNRVKAVLSTGIKTSWKLFSTNCELILPQDEIILEIFNEVDLRVSGETLFSIQSLFGKYLKAPYGMNVNAITLFVMYYIAFKGRNIVCYYGSERLSASYIVDKIFKGNKIQFNEIRKIQIKINQYATIDLVAILCVEIMNNNLVENCAKLQQKLDKVIGQEGSLIENETKVAQARIRLDAGSQISNKIYDNLKKAKEIINDSKHIFVIHKFVRIFVLIKNETGYIDDTLPYVYSEYFSKTREGLIKEANDLLNKNFEKTLSTLKCDITQLSQLKSLYKRVCETLREANREAYANKVDDRIVAIEEELIAKQKYESMILDCEKDIAMCSTSSSMSYKGCMDMLLRLTNWENFIQSKDDMTSNLKKYLGDKVKGAISNLEERARFIIEDVKKITDRVATAKDMISLQNISQKLEETLTYELPEEYVHSIMSTVHDIKACGEFIDNLPNDFEELIKVPESSGDMMNNCCYNIIIQQYQLRFKDMQEKEKMWIDKFIISVKAAAHVISITDCMNWISKTSILPQYISKDTLSEYENVRVLIEKRLQECRVQGVVTMFNQLNEAEKEQCLSILLNN